jgi:FRG domain
MFTQRDFQTWQELESFALQLKSDTARPAGADTGHYSDLLFRGQGSHGWSLQTTLERSAPTVRRLSEYYRAIAIVQTHLESLTPRRWPEVDYPSMLEELSNYDSLSLRALPHYSYLVHLRHHGFPSPLLDWSRSLYVAAFFAYQHVRSDRVAIFAYQEFAGVGKAGSSDRPQIHTLGPNIRTHERHFLQQGEYTTALRYQDGAWHLAEHIEVVNTDDRDQDNLWKLTAPSSFRTEVLRQLETYNINAYSLFQNEEALLATLAERHLPSH